MSTNMDEKINLQIDIQRRIDNAFKNYKKSPKERITSAYVETRLENLESLWAQFGDIHKTVVNYAEFKKSDYFKKDFYDLTEELFIEYKSELKSTLSKLGVNKKSENECQSMSANESNKMLQFNLPKITIPCFSGDYLEWPAFKDLFTSLIHNNQSLDRVQKLHYLKGCLKGEADQIVKHIPISEFNYDRCWSQLHSRYNNKRYLSHCIIKRLLSQRNILIESASALKNLLDTTTECLEGLANLDVPVNTWDIIIIHIIALKLDQESKRQWELTIASSNATDTLPTFNQFKDFIETRYRALEFIENKNVSKLQSNFSKPKVLHAVSTSNCQFCQENHRIIYCKKFAKEDVDTRRTFIQTHQMCFNCLGVNHSAKSCYSKTCCRICKRHHHSLLHPKGTGSSISGITEASGAVVASGSSSKNDSAAVGESATTAGPSSAPVVSCFSSGRAFKQILLATALVGVETQRGIQTIRALLDQGSQASFITEATVQFLGLPKIPIKGVISGIGGDSKLFSKSMVEIKIHSIFDKNVVIKVVAYVLNSITSFLPSKIVSLEWEELDNIQLADPKFNTPNKINILLGAEVYGRIIRDGLKRGPNGTPVAQATSLGWIISGAVKNLPASTAKVTVLHACVEENDMLKKFWELESDLNLKQNRMLTVEEERCEKLFSETTTRDSEGRYVVKLPFRNSVDPSMLPSESREIAEKRLIALESRLKKDEYLKKEYQKVIQEYLELGHMELVPIEDKNNTKAVYLPHHAVVKLERDTTKVRVVFDASCKGKNGISLNDSLMIGPTLQPKLSEVILRWRVFPICISADIIKMYRQVRVHKEHVDFQRLLWRDEGTAEMNHYRLLTVTFGTASAPYLAVKSLQQLAHDEESQGRYLTVTERVRNDYYMDDLMTGCDTEEEAIILYKDMTTLLEKGGFKLQKWTSNNNDLLNKIKDNVIMKGKENQKERDELKLKLDSTIKILGLTWCRDVDSFRYIVNLTSPKDHITKRNIISDISRLFDPLGWVAPSVVISKIIIQKLWLTGINWDDEVPENIVNEWVTYRQNLSRLNEIQIPRWFGTYRSNKIVELHGFCDASKLAYAAVVYIRTIDKDDQVYVNLGMAKTKVAPIKQVSIPRLELCGAVLVTRLLVEMSTILKISKQNLHAWTDSIVVLAWLNSHPSRWQTFVANRVAEIVTTLDPQQWSHVESKKNPADCASRGTQPAELLDTSIWFSGPDFLYQREIMYTKSYTTTDIEITKSHYTSFDTTIMDRFSSFVKLIRVIAYCRRFLNLRKQIGQKHCNKYLSVQEIKEATEVCIKLCQQEHFGQEIMFLHRRQPDKIKAPLKSLNTFLDSSGILRVGGRLDQSRINFNRKHPVLLPKRSSLTNLIVADAHLKTLHGGPQLMLAYLQTKYWVLGGNSLVKSIVRNCVTCVKDKAVSFNPMMGQLPAVRVTPAKPFQSSGVDFAGPINIRTAKGRGHKSYKGYICLFICMATRAIHLEVVSDLTTQGFLAAFKRFVARRGRCSDIYSDNGTNFVGASRELRNLFASEKSLVLEEIAESLATNNTSWHFIPPRSPNFGGLWEAGVKSAKTHLRRVIGNLTLTYEELSTALAQIEACLNSRPLSRIQSEADGIEVLTPGHFLVGGPLVTAPDHNFETANINNLRRWQLLQKLMQHFWKRWSREYLLQFFHRYRWSNQTLEPNLGDVVLVKEEDLPPSRWLYGVIVHKHPGPDNITRVVTLRCKTSLIKRPVSKLIVLPITS